MKTHDKPIDLDFNPINGLLQSAILSLASNFEASKNLALAEDHLCQLGVLQISAGILSPDKTSTKPVLSTDYCNQMAILSFQPAITYLKFLALSKQIERMAGRICGKSQVALDIDIIAIKWLEIEGINLNQYDETGTALRAVSVLSEDLSLSGVWWAIERRLPLASYEKMGLALLNVQVLE